MNFPSLEKLFAVAADIDDILADSAGDDDVDWFGEHFGLFIHEPIPGGDRPPPTPRNSWVFARTGGDGVHFGAVRLEGAVLDDSPIVMTVPMNFNRPHMIVGANLIDFLSLGCVAGYWYLENLTYDRETAVRHIAHCNAEFVGGDGNNFDDPATLQLCRGLGLSPWLDVERRLMELNTAVLHLLEIDGVKDV